LFLRLAGSLRSSRRDREFSDELASHLQLHIDDNVRAGMTPDEARRQALVALGGVEQTKDAYRDQRGLPVIESLLRDCRYGARLLLKSAGFSLAAVLILALGIGANTAIFSVVNAVVLRPLPFSEASRIMRVWHTPPPEQFSGAPIFAVSPANYIDWRSQNDVFERMAIYRYRQLNLTGQTEPDALLAAVVSPEFFDVLGVRPIAGRAFGPGDDEAGRANIVLLSEKMWKSRFGGDAAIVGRSIALNGEPHTVIGVVPQRLAFPETAQVWVPLVWTAKDRAVRGNHTYLVIARLKPGVDVARAQAELSTISKRLEQRYPADDKGWGALVLPLHQDLVGDVRWPLLVLLGAVAFVLLIACANLANLLLARTLGRAREIAIRAALGASRGRIVQQLLAESVMLGLAGGAAGLFAAQFGISAIVGSIGHDLPRVGEIDVDGRVLAFTCAIAILTGLLAGVAPAWRMTRGDASDALKMGQGRGGSETGERRLRNVLVISEVALALMLLVGAGLLIRTLWQLRAVDPGIDPRNVLTMTVAIPQTKYPKSDQQARFFDEALRRIRALPGVESASATDSLPLQGGSTQPVAIEGHPVLPLSEQPEVAVRALLPDYIRTVRMRLLDGRDFTAADTPDRPARVLVSASMARRFWPNERAIGRHLTLGLMSAAPREVIGIVNDVKLLGLDTPNPVAAVYVPLTQAPTFSLSIVVRTAVPPGTVAPAVINAIHLTDPEQPILDIMTMDEVIGASLRQQRFAMLLLTVFAVLALGLAGVGIYGVLSYTVRQRVREIGIRMALGAPAAEVLRMVITEGMKPTLVGLAIGIASAAALGRMLASLIFGVSARDAATFTAVSIIVIAVGLVASAVPAYRATRIDPLQALRTE
jgi:predicted permease